MITIGTMQVTDLDTEQMILLLFIKGMALSMDCGFLMSSFKKTFINIKSLKKPIIGNAIPFINSNSIICSVSKSVTGIVPIVIIIKSPI